MHPLAATYLLVALVTTFHTLHRVPDEQGPLAPDWIDRFVLALTAIVAGAVWPLLAPFMLAAWWSSRRTREARQRLRQRLSRWRPARPFAGKARTPAIEASGAETPRRIGP
jgi:hypothetical protein